MGAKTVSHDTMPDGSKRATPRDGGQFDTKGAAPAGAAANPFPAREGTAGTRASNDEIDAAVERSNVAREAYQQAANELHATNLQVSAATLASVYPELKSFRVSFDIDNDDSDMLTVTAASTFEDVEPDNEDRGLPEYDDAVTETFNETVVPFAREDALWDATEAEVDLSRGWDKAVIRYYGSEGDELGGLGVDGSGR